MTITEAKRTFANLMAAARQRPLTATERGRLTIARQSLRRGRRPAMNAGKRYGTYYGYIYGIGHDGKQEQIIGPSFATRDKAAYWLATAKVVAQRTGFKIHTARIDRGYGPTPKDNKRGTVTRAKALKILKEGKARGRKLTAKQKKFFGARASGSPPRPNPGLIRMGKLVELRYERDHGRSPGFYKHTFKTKPTVYYQPSTNTIVVKGR